MCGINTAAELLEIMRLGCYDVDIKDGFIEVLPAFPIDDEMADLIRMHKAELIKILVK
jgi:hypothetical protein